jgi:pimeloyl-ACP methyl ester carboxylesterase
MSEQPTLLLVHGAWGGAWCWEPVVGPLRERDVEVDVIDRLPTAGSEAGRLGDLAADAEHVRERLDAAGGPVVLCGHSYGGMVITEVADHPAIVHSVYLAALWPPEGVSVLDLFNNEVPDWVIEHEDGTMSVTEDFERSHQVMCADVDRDRAEWMRELLVLQSRAGFEAKSSAPERTHPVTYIICTEDQAIPPPAQEAMSAPADNKIRMESGHFPQLSRTEELADALEEVVAAHTGAPAA